MRRKILSVFMIFIIATSSVYASIDNLMDSIVTGVQVTKPGVYTSNSRTTGSLGSMSFRLNTSGLNEPLVTFSPPKATLSCSGMDFDAGQISLLNLNMISDMVTNMGASAAWGIMLGLVYSTPGISEGLSKLNELTRWAQMLNQSPCEVGIAAGQAIGQKLWSSTSKNTAENTVGVGTYSVFGEAMKKVKQNMKQQDIFQTYPYGILQKAGITDSEIMDLFATWYGVVDIYLIDSDGEKMAYSPTASLSSCGGSACDENNINVNEYKGMNTDLDVFIYGGKTKMYKCNGSILSGVCTGAITLTEDIQVKGIKNLIVQNIKGLRNGLATPFGGSGSISSTTITTAIQNQDNAAALYTYAAMIPNFYEVLSYSALLTKSPDPELKNVADEMVEDMAEVMAYRLIDRFFSLSYEYLTQATAANSALLSKATETISKYNKNAMESYNQIQLLMEKANQKSEFYSQAAKRYQSYYDYTSKKLLANVNGLQIKK